MTWVDRLSRRVHFIAGRVTDTANEVAKSFFSVILPQHGLPDAIISDRDPKFVSRFWKELMKLCGVKLKMSSAQHPQTDGASEVMNRMIENYLRCYCEFKQENWDLLLPSAEFAYNSAVSEDLGMSPFEADLGWKPRDPLDFFNGKQSDIASVDDLKQLLKSSMEDALYAHKLAKAKQSAKASTHCKVPNYKVGDMVWVSRKLLQDAYTKERPSMKLSARRFGPFPILRLIGKNAVELDLPAYLKTHRVIHVSFTRPYRAKPTRLQDEVPIQAEKPMHVDQSGEALYIVEKILSHRRRGRGYQFLTLLKGTPQHDAEWQPVRDFVDSDGTMNQEFDKYIKQNNILRNLWDKHDPE